jgi:hypothetical protein
MAKKQKQPSEPAQHTQPDCLELLKEFVKEFERIPQRYCRFCKAKTALGIDVHKPDCPLRRASSLIREKK